MKLRASTYTHRSSAMTLIELMVAVTLMTVIVLGLYKVFDRTQRAMRDGANQIDTTETGRSTMGILLRDLEQMADSGSTNEVNFDLFHPAYSNNVATVFPSGDVSTNINQELFFLKKGQHWTGVGFLVMPGSDPGGDDALNQAGIRSLYRFEIETNILQLRSNNLLNAYINERTNLVQKVADGVVHFNIRAYTNGVLVTNMLGEAETTLQLAGLAPSHIDLEFGILEPKVLEEVRSIPNTAAISNYLYRLPSSFQIYKSRIRIPAGAVSAN